MLRRLGQENNKVDNDNEKNMTTSTETSKVEKVEEAVQRSVVNNDTAMKSSKHETLIIPHHGKHRFIVNCKCHWQGRAFTIGEANQLAASHMEKHIND